jgi:uncharacterized Zn finger protein
VTDEALGFGQTALLDWPADTSTPNRTTKDRSMFDTLITRITLARMAGVAVFARGDEYFLTGAVSALHAGDAAISATVQGSRRYHVQLEVDDGLSYSCTCPHASEGYFCKHCVAVALAWLNRHKGDESPTHVAAPDDVWREIERYLAAQSADVLRQLLRDAARRDEHVAQALLLRAKQIGGDFVVTYQIAIDGATRVDDYIEWREAAGFSEGIDRVIDSMEVLLEPATGGDLMDLVEYAMDRIEEVLPRVDDSGGEMETLAERLGELHLKACRMARPDPDSLAQRLFVLQTTLEHVLCRFDPLTYSDVLGERGMQRYRELAQASWDAPNGVGCAASGERFRVARILEQLAEASGVAENLVAIMARDLSSGDRYLKIAAIWTKAGQHEQAISWAERGLQAFPQCPDYRLRDSLMEAYTSQGRHSEALSLIWAQFEESPGLVAYKKLHRIAGACGEWPAHRERALAVLDAAITREAARGTYQRPAGSPPDYSPRIEIALWENDLDAAWSAAQRGRIHTNVLIALADRLAAPRPDDAISLYRRVVPAIIERTSNTAYGEAIVLIRKVGVILVARQQQRQWNDYLSELRTRFKAKRNFIKLLARL